MATRPRTPVFNFAQQAGPSSPPATPTTATSNFPFNSNHRRHGIQNFSRPISTRQNGEIIPNGNGTFSYNPFQPLDLELSPRSSSPASSTRSSEAEVDSPRPRSRSSSPGARTSTPPRITIRTRIVAEGNFTLEEFDEDDYEAFDSGASSPLRPHQYEDAESEPPRSTRGTSPNRELDPRILHGISQMNCAPEEEEFMADRAVWEKKMKDERRRKRRSSSSVQKRSLAQSIGSDTDNEDIQQPMFEDANEAGSTARRLRRKVAGERTSLIFDDPPPRIEELEEPESCEEVVSVDDDEGHTQGVDRNLPYYVMEIDTDDD